MSKTIVLTDEKYEQFADYARLRGFQSVEQLFEEDQFLDAKMRERRKELEQRRELGKEMDELRQKIENEIGVMPDNTPLLREDRER